MMPAMYRARLSVVRMFLCWEFVLINSCGVLDSQLRKPSGGSWQNSKHRITVPYLSWQGHNSDLVAFPVTSPPHKWHYLDLCLN